MAPEAKSNITLICGLFFFFLLLLKDCRFTSFEKRCKVDGQTERHFSASQANFQAPQLHGAGCRVLRPCCLHHGSSDPQLCQRHWPWGCMPVISSRSEKLARKRRWDLPGLKLLYCDTTVSGKPLLVALFSAQQRKRKVAEAQGLSSSGIS